MVSKRVLKECPVFEALRDADLDRIASFSESREYEAGALIFGQGSSAEKLYVLEKGKVALQMQLPTAQPQLMKRVTVDIVTRNDVFGWSAAIGRRVFILTAICLEPTRVLAIDGSKLRALLQDDTRIGYHILSRLIEVVASRLDETRHVLIGERLGSIQT